MVERGFRATTNRRICASTPSSRRSRASTPNTPASKPEEIVASICAYEEEGNIGGVLEKMPTTIDGEPYTDARRRRRRRGPHGRDRALLPGCASSSSSRSTSATAWRCRSRIATASTSASSTSSPSTPTDRTTPPRSPDPGAPARTTRPTSCSASRVLGVDKTSDSIRKTGVRFFSFIMNRMTERT